MDGSNVLSYLNNKLQYESLTQTRCKQWNASQFSSQWQFWLLVALT